MKPLTITPVFTSVSARNSDGKRGTAVYYGLVPFDRGAERWVLAHFKTHVVHGTMETHWYTHYGAFAVGKKKDGCVVIPLEAYNAFRNYRWWANITGSTEPQLTTFEDLVQLGKAGKVAHVCPEGGTQWTSAKEFGFV